MGGGPGGGFGGWGGGDGSGYFGGGGYYGDTGGSPNDCVGGPCVPFQFSVGSCTGYVTYSIEAIAVNGTTELHAMPSISYGCGGGASSGLSITQITASAPTSSSSGGQGGANNGQLQTPQQPKPQQPCYGSNSLTDKAVRLFSLVRLPQTLGEWILGGSSKFAFFKAAQAGATSAGGEESMALPYINGTGAALGIASMAATGGATIMDARCQIGADVNPIEPVPH